MGHIFPPSLQQDLPLLHWLNPTILEECIGADEHFGISRRATRDQLCVTTPPLSSLHQSNSNFTTDNCTAAIKATEFLFKDLPSLQSPLLGAGDGDGKWGRNLLLEELPSLCLRMTWLQLPQDCPHAHHCHLACLSQASSFC